MRNTTTRLWIRREVCEVTDPTRPNAVMLVMPRIQWVRDVIARWSKVRVVFSKKCEKDTKV